MDIYGLFEARKCAFKQNILRELGWLKLSVGCKIKKCHAEWFNSQGFQLSAVDDSKCVNLRFPDYINTTLHFAYCDLWEFGVAKIDVDEEDEPEKLAEYFRSKGFAVVWQYFEPAEKSDFGGRTGYMFVFGMGIELPHEKRHRAVRACLMNNTSLPEDVIDRIILPFVGWN